jgi:predicted RNase H-like HicB family nuclease
MKSKPLTIITWKEGANWVAECLNNHVSSFGDTKEEAEKNVREALELYFEEADEEIAEVDQASVSVTEIQHA